MALKIVGVKFVAEGYDKYIRDLKAVQKVQKDALKKQQTTLDSDFKKAADTVAKESKKAADAVQQFANVTVDAQGKISNITTTSRQYQSAAANITASTKSMQTSMNDAGKSALSLRDRLASASQSSLSSRLQKPVGVDTSSQISGFTAGAMMRPQVAAEDLRGRLASMGGMSRTFTTEANSAFDAAMKLRSASMDTSTAMGKLRSAFQMPAIQTFTSGISSGAQGLVTFGKSLYDMIPGFIKWAGLLTAVMKIWQFFQQSGNIAQRNETLAVTLNEMGTAAGYTAEQIAAATEKLKQQGITTSAASQSLIRMSRANISWAEASKLAAIAQGAAVAAGMNSSDAFERLILGVQKMEPELLDELGITLQRSQAYKALAQELGVSETALTQQQKQQAILNEIYRQSESVLGVYDAAMETSGKRQGSLTRYVEETQASIGKLMLPFKELSIDMQTNFWKGLQKVAKGFESWVPLIRAAIQGFQALPAPIKALTGLINPMLALGNIGGDTFDRLGRGAHDWARVTVESGAIVLAAWDTLVQNSEMLKQSLMEDWIEWANLVTSPLSTIAGKALASALTGEEMNILPKGVGTQLGKDFGANFQRALGDVQKAFPDIFKSWEELNTPINTDIDLNPPTDDSTDALAEQAELLQQQLEIFKKIDEIVEDYNQKVKDANADYQKAINKLNEDAAKQEEALRAKTEKAMSKAASDGVRQRQKLIEDANRSRLREEQRANKELERERQRFLLAQKHSMEQFKLSETRLIAEGDVLAVKELRENFALQQQQAQESFQQSQQFAKEDVQQSQQLRQEDLQQQLRDLDNSIAERQMQLQESYQEELASQREANEQRKADLDEHLQEQLTTLAEARNAQLTQLGETLQEEGKITEDGMKTIYGKMVEVMGENGPADALMKGFKERTKTTFSDMISSIITELNNLGSTVGSMAASTSSSGGMAGGSPYPSVRPGGRSSLVPTKMRQGGVGVVTGPATFAVEPGQREAVMFAPLPSSRAAGTLDVNMAGGFDIRGAEPAGREATEAALDRMVLEFTQAVRRVRIR